MGYLGHDHHHGKQLAKQGESTVPRTFASAPTRVRAADGTVLCGGSTCPLPSCLTCGHLFVGQAEADAITAELVACTLGQRSRPELVALPVGAR